MEGKLEAYGKWFCSENCIKTYAIKNNLKYKTSIFEFLKNRLFQLILITAILAIFNYKFKDELIFYIKKIAVPVVAGFTLSALIDLYIPDEIISRHLHGRNFLSILKSSFLGFLFSGCSHGCLALSMTLYKKGASTSSVMAFLLASPWANLSITFLLISFFGAYGVLFIVISFIISVISGVIYSKLKFIEKNPATTTSGDFSIKHFYIERFKKFSIGDEIKKFFLSLKTITDMVLFWILLGVFISSIVAAFVPESFMHTAYPKNIFGVLTTLLTATLIEVCSEGSSPIAFEIYKHSTAYGNAFVFLNAGVATDFTEIGAIWKNIGKKTAIMLPVITIPQIVVTGILFNRI